jgi:hypothetical protein
MDHPHYLPNLGPCDFWLFPKLKHALKGQIFADISDIQRNVMLPQGILENNFQDCFQQWYRQLTKCVRRVVPSTHEVRKESISKVTAAASAEVSKFCFHRANPRIKLSHLVLHALEHGS